MVPAQCEKIAQNIAFHDTDKAGLGRLGWFDSKNETFLNSFPALCRYELVNEKNREVSAYLFPIRIHSPFLPHRMKYIQASNEFLRPSLKRQKGDHSPGEGRGRAFSPYAAWEGVGGKGTHFGHCLNYLSEMYCQVFDVQRTKIGLSRIGCLEPRAENCHC